MSKLIKDLGAVSAYAYAVEKGYTGTEDEFGVLMASYASVAQEAGRSATDAGTKAKEAKQSAQTASEAAQTTTTKASDAQASATASAQSATSASASATSAQASATTATAKASEAQQSATTATTKAQEASQSASTASQSAQTAVQAKQDAESAKTASETAQGKAEDAQAAAQEQADRAEAAAESIDFGLDAVPTQGSTNAVQSGGVWSALAGLDARIDALEQNGLTSDIKNALLQIAQKIAYVDDGGQNYYDALYNALYPPIGLVSISAVYTQSKAVYQTTALDTLKDDLVVTAHYTDSTTETITNYTLSGTLTAGTSVITVSYGGKTTTISVTVTSGVMPLYQWDLTQSLVDEIDGITAVTTGTQGSNGLVINANASGEYCDFGAVYSRNRTYELDIVQIERNTALNARTIMFDVDEVTQQRGSGLINCRSSSGSRYGWYFYLGSAWDTALISGTPEDVEIDAFNGKTIKLYLDENGIAQVYSKTIGADDSEYVSIGTSGTLNDYTNGHVYIGSTDSSDALKNAVFSGLRIYEGEK